MSVKDWGRRRFSALLAAGPFERNWNCGELEIRIGADARQRTHCTLLASKVTALFHQLQVHTAMITPILPGEAIMHGAKKSAVETLAQHGPIT